MKRMVVGVIGPISSGKGEVAKILLEKGYISFSLSDRIREEAVRRNLVDPARQREILQNLGDELRFTFGEDVLAQRTVALIEEREQRNVVVESIRHPSEILCFRQRSGAKIIGVTASQNKRFEYLKFRKRIGDPESFEEFLRIDNRELRGEAGSHRIQIQECLKMADVVIENERGLIDLKIEIEKSLIGLGIEGEQVKQERE